ncbi:MAG TPA: hypothetical protein VJ762_15305 [Sphingobium sp.]|nr:hypothetical protein [Sphingobium sp.]
MNEYLSRNELTQVDRVAARKPSVSAVQPVSAQQSSLQTADSHAGKPQEADVGSSLAEDDLAGAAEYAKVHARVADILADLRSSASSVEGAEAAIQSLLPTPIILVPLPPASKEAVESAVGLGKRIAEQASYAHGAQAHLRRGTVGQVLSTVV